MRTVTHAEIQASMDRVYELTESETHKFMARMQKEQPYIPISDRSWSLCWTP